MLTCDLIVYTEHKLATDSHNMHTKRYNLGHIDYVKHYINLSILFGKYWSES